MARRLALLTVLACALALRPSPPTKHVLVSSSSDDSASESFDPFVLIDDSDYSYETTSSKPRPKPTQSSKVILRTKVNATVKNTKSDSIDKVVKMKNESIIKVFNKKPVKMQHSWKLKEKEGSRPLVEVFPQFVLVGTDIKILTSTMDTLSSSAAPSTSRPPPPPPPPPSTTARPRPTSRRPSTRKPHRTTRPPHKSIKKTQIKTTCPPKDTGWISSFFQEKNKYKKVEKKPSKPTWFSGLLSKVYKWIWGTGNSASSDWFGGGSWFQEQRQSTSTTTTTPQPTTAPSWFQSILESEEDDGAYVTNITKKPQKKAVKKSYKGYQLIRAYPDAQWKVHELLDLQDEAQDSGLMWWTPPSINGSTDLLVPPDLMVDIKEHLKSLKIDFDVVIWDLQKAISYENPKLSKKQRLELEQLRGHPMTWRRYHRYADILRYLEYLQHSYSDVVELVPLGRSSEGLPLVVVKVSLPNDAQSNKTNSQSNKKKWKLRSRMKPAVWIEGGAHAREWIAPAVATWMLHTLAEGEKGLGSDYEMLKQADFYIMPVVNPDGYEHSHTHDRLWRKTRSRHADNNDDFTSWLPWNWGRSDCVGVDADRNWDYHWGEKDASKDPCADNYAGPHPFSEPETRAVSAFLSEHRDLMKVYISLHSYSQAWLIPSSHAHASFSDDGMLMEMGKLATAALADVYGTKYQIGSAAELRQPASGMSHDWAKARAGVKFSYHVDLRDSFGPYGFLLPGSQIVSTSKETWQAVKAIVDNLNPG